MSVLNFLGDLIKPVTGLIDSLHTSDEEKLTLKTKMVDLQNQMAGELLGYERKVLDAQAQIITAEAQGESWLQRSWRPITMLTFLVLVVLDTLGLTAFRLSDEAWSLLQIGLGGYVVGRSGEKIAPHLKQMVGKKP